MELKTIDLDGYQIFELTIEQRRIVEATIKSPDEQDYSSLFDSYPELEEEFRYYIDQYGSIKYRPSVRIQMSIRRRK